MHLMGAPLWTLVIVSHPSDIPSLVLGTAPAFEKAAAALGAELCAAAELADDRQRESGR
jgi:hypothetical protein